ncbi:MAG: hypothetical protein WD897_00720 [Parcubacteria group bacterium]
MTYYKKSFTPRKPVRSFRDLEVYQKTLECAVLVGKNLKPALSRLKYPFLEDAIKTSLFVPLYIGEAHSSRFADGGGLEHLEKAMVGCNRMIIYLEYIKGLYGSKADIDLVDDIIERYAGVRTKCFHLELSWKKFRANNFKS